ncbi:hypothetical protein [Kamptonema formosum]|uniref:hypothetical protein n=1 Tax=Kamptonema formosum TaxID=331992 RepID=UPI00034D136B|nr:hypothetical protein [Oscillatoria sp. PCC 10802]
MKPPVNLPHKKRNRTIETLQPAVDPAEDLVYGGGYTGNPEEIVQNPAVSPRMYSTERELRGDLRDEER